MEQYHYSFLKAFWSDTILEFSMSENSRNPHKRICDSKMNSFVYLCYLVVPVIRVQVLNTKLIPSDPDWHIYAYYVFGAVDRGNGLNSFQHNAQKIDLLFIRACLEYQTEKVVIN